MNLARQAATRTAYRLMAGIRRMLVGTHRRAINHQRFQSTITIDSFNHLLPYARFTPALEPHVRRVPVSQFCWQVSPK
jgi:hypothetical protein